MNNPKVAIELYVDDKGSLRIREFSSRSQQEFKKVEKAGTGAAARIKAAWQSVKGAWVEIIGIIMALNTAWDMMNVSAKAQQEERAFASLAASYGTNAKTIIASLKEASGQTIDTMTLIRDAGTAMMMGIEPDKVVELMKIAKATAKMTGQDVSKAFGDISLAVGRQSRMILDNLGIIVDVEQANNDYARSLGKTASQLTDTDKKQAFMNATLKAGGELMDKLGNQTDTAADKLARWKARWNDARIVIGKVLLTIAMGVEGIFTAAGSTINSFAGTIASLGAELTGLAAKIPLVGRAFVGVNKSLKNTADISKGAAVTGIKHLEETWGTMLSLWKEGEPTTGKVLKNLRDQKGAAEGLGKAQKKLAEQQKKTLDAAKKAADEKTRAENEMYKEAGLGAERYYRNQADELIEKAAKWQEAGATQLETENWLYDQLGKLSEEAREKQEFGAMQAMDNLQNQAGTLIDELNLTMQSGMEKLEEYGIKIDGLDGSHIGITASLDGSGISSTIDALIVKFDQLKAAASSASSATSSAANSGGGSSTGNDTDDQGTSNSPTTNINSYHFNQQMSRSDATNIISEQERMNHRS